MTKQASGALGGFTSVRRVRSPQHVRAQLLAAIDRGDYPPGAALPSERVLCDTFGVSRVSVREAIAGLESTGLITVEHGRGAFVRESVNNAYAGPFVKYLQVHRHELVELLQVRGALDELAAAEATQRADADLLVQLQVSCNAFQQAVESGERDFEKLSEFDVNFHCFIATLSQGQLLPRLIRELNGVLEESRRITLARPGQLGRSVREHQAIVDAIVARDANAARRAVRKHVGNIRRWVDGLEA